MLGFMLATNTTWCYRMKLIALQSDDLRVQTAMHPEATSAVNCAKWALEQGGPLSVVTAGHPPPRRERPQKSFRLLRRHRRLIGWTRRSMAPTTQRWMMTSSGSTLHCSHATSRLHGANTWSATPLAIMESTPLCTRPLVWTASLQRRPQRYDWSGRDGFAPFVTWDLAQTCGRAMSCSGTTSTSLDHHRPT